MTVAGAFGSFPKTIVKRKLSQIAFVFVSYFYSMSQCGSIFLLLKM